MLIVGVENKKIQFRVVAILVNVTARITTMLRQKLIWSRPTQSQFL